jgi:aerobic C4-dicarboxylate transport protein
VQVLIAIAIGAALGYFSPQLATQFKPLGDGFIKLVKMLIGPIIFCTVVAGIAGMGDMKRVGRVGLKAILYFEAVTTLALLIGLGVVRTLQPGAGINADPSSFDPKAVAAYAEQAHALHAIDFLLNVIPSTFVDAFVRGEILQVLLVSVLFGVALAGMGARGAPISKAIGELAHAFFGMVAIVMRLAPLGAFGAMAFTIGKYGIGTLLSLGKLMAGVYVTCFLFVFLVLGLVMGLLGLSIWQLVRYLREELLIVLGTSSSESVLPRLMAKLEALGCEKSVVGLTVPTGYSFNLDGTCIYLTMAAIFIAQATNTHLTLGQELTILFVLMLSSKGAAAVTGGGFITLAATLSAVPALPVAALSLILGVDRFMSEARALTNMVGNAVATLVVARWENGLDLERARAVLAAGEPLAPMLPPAEAPVPETVE